MVFERSANSLYKVLNLISNVILCSLKHFSFVNLYPALARGDIIRPPIRLLFFNIHTIRSVLCAVSSPPPLPWVKESQSFYRWTHWACSWCYQEVWNRSTHRKFFDAWAQEHSQLSSRACGKLASSCEISSNTYMNPSHKLEKHLSS